MIGLGILACIVAGFLVLPRPTFIPASWSDPFDRSVRIFQFSKYSIPETYEFVSYMHSIGDNKKFVTFRNKSTKQQIFMMVLNELPKVRLKDISFIPKKMSYPLQEIYRQTIRGSTNFGLRYLVPLFIQKTPTEEYPNAEIRGLAVTSQERLETPTTQILVADGTFEELYFHRISPSRFKKYPVPIFHSERTMKGAVAVISSKKTGETIFAFGCNYATESFDRDEFLSIIKTVTFDKDPKALFGPK